MVPKNFTTVLFRAARALVAPKGINRCRGMGGLPLGRPISMAKAIAFGGMSVALLVPLSAFASRVSWRNAHPVGWMHQLPVGETPGWSSPFWINLEINHANVWNMNSSYTDTRTGDVYTYEADFEQSSTIADIGFSLGSRFALSFEVPYANRNGGFLDDFIDQFHILIQSDRFLRHLNDDFNNSLVIQKNGQDMIASHKAEGVGNIKAKAKYWLLKWQSPTPGVCDCGLAVSGQVKYPMQRRQHGLTSGTNDYSGLIHLGAPLGRYSGVYTTAAFTKFNANESFAGWPRREWQQMYELSFDFGLGPGFGVLLQARLESPLFDIKYLSFNYSYSDPDNRSSERVASGWHSLVDWRGSQAFGLRYRWGKGSQLNLLMMEDWGLGDRDGRGDWNYVNNAPDVAFLTQWHLVF
ncbi:MAG: DUF3187 family protein [Calothrix sp. SM1_5_4]|nr:DUF3187 family protein [Calothrix sp. SM1_5_4]